MPLVPIDLQWFITNKSNAAHYADYHSSLLRATSAHADEGYYHYKETRDYERVREEENHTTAGSSNACSEDPTEVPAISDADFLQVLEFNRDFSDQASSANSIASAMEPP